MKSLLSLLIILVAGLTISFDVIANKNQMDQTIEVSKNAIPEKRKAYIAKVIKIDDANSMIFWKLYDSYTQELSVITNASYALLDKYARSYKEEKVTNKLAGQLMKEHFKLKTQKNKITKKYLKKISESFSDTLSMRFLQAEEKMYTIINYTYQFDIPLIDFK
jgi:hypothetical protein